MPENTVDLSQIESRTPILTSGSPETFRNQTKIEKEWLLTTEAIKREIIRDPNVREEAMRFISTPLSESLPAEFSAAISNSSPLVKKLTSRYDKSLGEYLSLPQVPDEQLLPDITYAPRYELPENQVGFLERVYKPGTPKFQEALQAAIDGGRFLRGITPEEKKLVALRYRYARDTKLLALGAEILSQEGNIALDGNLKAELPSGIQIEAASWTNEKQQADLLNPQQWEKRRQIKDRVYEVTVGGNRYILKEKKTARHTDTARNGHVEGSTSKQEFEVAEKLHQEGEEESSQIKVSWELPIGCVNFPDGFQFALFEYQTGLLEERNIWWTIKEKIIENREQFEEEYQSVSSAAKRFANNPVVLETEKDSRGINLASLKRKLKKGDQVLSFEEFARVKSYRLQEQAKTMMTKNMMKVGYINSDIDGYGYRMINDDGEFKLEILGFDFERFTARPRQELDEIQEQYAEDRVRYNEQGLHFANWNDGYSVNKAENAAYFGLLALDGEIIFPDRN